MNSCKYILKENKILFFVNAFAANDRSSTLLIWENINKNSNLNNLPKIGIINNRADRVLRSVQFAHILAKEIILSKIILVGPISKLTERTLLKLKVGQNNIINLGRLTDPEKVLEIVLKFFNEKGVLLGLGNTKGMGQKLIEYFEEFGDLK